MLAPLAAAYLLVLGGGGTAVSEGPGHLLMLMGSGVVTAVPLLLFGGAAGRVPLTQLGLLQYLAPTLQFAIGVLLLRRADGPAAAARLRARVARAGRLHRRRRRPPPPLRRGCRWPSRSESRGRGAPPGRVITCPGARAMEDGAGQGRPAVHDVLRKGRPMTTLLLVDDHRVVREALAAMLTAVDGLTAVHQAGTGEEALARYAALRPDGVVLDVRMPGLDGIEVTTQLLKEHPAARVLLLSGEAREEDRARGLRAGALGFLVKDVDAAGLCRAVSALLAGEDLLTRAQRRALASEPARQRAGAVAPRAAGARGHGGRPVERRDRADPVGVGGHRQGPREEAVREDRRPRPGRRRRLGVPPGVLC